MYIPASHASANQNFYNAPQLISNRFRSEAPRTTVAECERAYDTLAYSQAPLNIATAADMRVDLKYNSDFLDLYESAREDILSKRNCLDPPCHTIPEGDLFDFSELVLHVFSRCVHDSSWERGSPFVDPRTPSPTDWPSIFPAYPTLKTYLDRANPSSLSAEYPYMREYVNPGITSLFVLPFLKMLKERKDDPVVVLAVHMQVLSCIRKLACPYIGPYWILTDGRDVCREEMEEFVRSQEVVQWLRNHPRAIKEEWDSIIAHDIILVTRNERIKATLHRLEKERAIYLSMAGYLEHS